MARKGWLLPLMLGMLLGLLLAINPLLATTQPRSAGPELQVFVREGCPHCAAAKAFLPELQKLRPGIQVRLRPLESDPAAIDDLLRYSRQAGIQAPGVPTFIGVQIPIMLFYNIYNYIAFSGKVDVELDKACPGPHPRPELAPFCNGRNRHPERIRATVQRLAPAGRLRRPA